MPTSAAANSDDLYKASDSDLLFHVNNLKSWVNSDQGTLSLTARGFYTCTGCTYELTDSFTFKIKPDCSGGSETITALSSIPDFSYTFHATMVSVTLPATTTSNPSYCPLYYNTITSKDGTTWASLSTQYPGLFQWDNSTMTL